MRLTDIQKKHAENLRWHWATVCADSGLRSSHSALVAIIESGASGTSGRPSYDDAMVDRCDRKRDAQAAHLRIEAALRMTTADQSDVLFLAYGAKRPPLGELGRLARMGDLALVTQATTTARERYAASTTKLGLWPWLLTAGAQKILPLERIETEAAKLLLEAHRAYETAAEGPRPPRAPRTSRPPEPFSPSWAGAEVSR